MRHDRICRFGSQMRARTEHNLSMAWGRRLRPPRQVRGVLRPPVGPMEQNSDYIRACYDAVAREYAERFTDELAHKPLDRELLSRFASEVGGGQVYDLGCGPGQTTAFL